MKTDQQGIVRHETTEQSMYGKRGFFFRLRARWKRFVYQHIVFPEADFLPSPQQEREQLMQAHQSLGMSYKNCHELVFPGRILSGRNISGSFVSSLPDRHYTILIMDVEMPDLPYAD
jgi:hypothetical protein